MSSIALLFGDNQYIHLFSSIRQCLAVFGSKWQSYAYQYFESFVLPLSQTSKNTYLTIMKQHLKIILLVGAFASVCYWRSIKDTSKPDSLILQNIEALAENEYPSVNTECIGNGSVDCPIGNIKVKYVIEGYSLR